MQNVLSFTVNKKKYVSNQFDFETFCRINENHLNEEKKGVYSICADAVAYMFRGTEATEDILSNLDVAECGKLCLSLWKMYVAALEEISKNE